MKTDYVIVGSGLAAVGAVKALINRGIKPTVLDYGDRLPKITGELSKKLKQMDKDQWEEDD